MTNIAKEHFKKLLSQTFIIRLMLSIGIFFLGIYLYELGGVWAGLGLILGIPSIVIISKQIIEIISVFVNIIAKECSANQLHRLVDKKIIVSVSKLSAGFVILIFCFLAVSAILRDLRESSAQRATIKKWHQEEQERLYYDTHNSIHDEIKKVYLSYLKGHQEDISENFQVKSLFIGGKSHLYLISESAFSYLALDTATQFNLPDEADEFKYKDYLTQELPKISLNSKVIVSNEIKQASYFYQKDIPIKLFARSYNFNTKRFNIDSMSRDYDGEQYLPLVCAISTKNVSTEDGKLILNDAEKESYHYSEELGVSFGKDCYEPNSLETLSSRNPYSYNYNAQSKEDDDIHTVAGAILPPLYLDLSNFYAIGEDLERNGLFVPSEEQARKISNHTEYRSAGTLLNQTEIPGHEINGLITVEFSPEKDCNIQQVCILNKTESPTVLPWDSDVSKPSCTVKKVMICKPTFDNFRLQL